MLKGNSKTSDEFHSATRHRDKEIMSTYGFHLR